MDKNNLFKISILIALFLLFIFIESFQLDKLPNVLNQDEMSFSMGAKKIAETGYDLCGRKMPLFPCQIKEMPYQGFTISYYLTALFYKIHTPHNIFDIRLFSILIGAITGIIFFFFADKMLGAIKNKYFYASLFSIIFYFSPGIFIIQRFGSPWYILPVLLHLSLLFFIYKFHKTKEKKLLLFIPIISAVLMLDYQVYRLFAPLYLLFFILIFRNEIKNRYFLGGLTVFSAIFFLILFQTLSDTYFTSAYLSDKGFALWYLFLHYYSFKLFYFETGLSFFYSFRYGLFQSLTITFFLFGLAWILKNIRQNKFFQFILLSLATYPLAAIATKEPYVTNRIIDLIPIYFIILVYGFIILVKLIELSKKKVFSLLPVALLVLILLQSFYFLYDYFFITSSQNNYCVNFNNSYAGHNCNFIGLFDYLQSKKVDKIYFDSSLVFINAYVDFYNNIMSYNIKNYEVLDIMEKTSFRKNSIIVISKNKAEMLELDKKYKLIRKINEPNTAESFFYVFETNNL